MNKKRATTIGAAVGAVVLATTGIAVAQSASQPAQTDLVAVEASGQFSQGQGHGHGHGAGKGHGQGHGEGKGQEQGLAAMTEPAGELTAEMEAQLSILAEEEQLAHDLYVLADSLYGSDTSTYGNISGAEVRHFTAMNKVLDVYGLDFETEMDEPGTFDNDDLQAAYDELSARVKTSAAEAAAVGVLAEETDIADLEKALALDPPSDVSRVLSNLIRASEQHLSSFQNLAGQL